MSAGVSDQRMKGQGNHQVVSLNGPKEHLGAGGEGPTSVGSEDFEPWRSQQQQQQQQQQNSAAVAAAAAAAAAYGTASVPPISSATDLYNMSTAGYYGSGAGGTYPYQAYGVSGDGTWSNGTDPMTFLSGYPHDSYSMDGMFGPSTTFSTPTAFGQPSSFNYFHSNGDYSTWGNQLGGGGGGQRKYDDYYRDPQNMYAQAVSDSPSLKSVEQAMQSLDLKAASSGAESSSAKESSSTTTTSLGGGGQAKKTTWASIASQPAKPQQLLTTIQNQGLKKKGPGMPPGPIVPGKHNMDIIGTWDVTNHHKNTPPTAPQLPPVINCSNNQNISQSKQPAPQHPSIAMNVRPPGGGGWNNVPASNRQQPPGSAPRPGGQHPMQPYHQQQQQQGPMVMPPHLMPPPPPPPPLIPMMVTTTLAPPPPTHPVLDELKVKNNYNPTDFDLTGQNNARFFVIKSYSEDDIHRSIKYEIWCSTEHGNKRLDQAYRDGAAAIFLFFSVNGSGHFCGMAQMVSHVDYNASSSVWSQDKWKGQFKVRWVYVKDVPNVQLRHIRLENNENKPVTNSRDTQEVPHSKGLQVLRIMHSYRHSTSIFDDFIHYEKRQEEEDNRKQPSTATSTITSSSSNNNKDDNSGGAGGHHHHHQHHHHHNNNSNNNNSNGVVRGDQQRPDHHKGRNHDHREGDNNNHRQGGGGGHRNNNQDHHHGGGHHNKDRGDNNRGRGGRGGRN